MAHSFHPSQASMTGYTQEPPPLSAYSILGQNQYPESVALWHSPSTQPQQEPQSQSHISAAPYTPATPKTPSLLQPLPDQKKHKRTRSGCFTCRSRRIKCDENRPACERCRKGNRECVYPTSTTGPASKSAPRNVAKTKASRPQSRGSDSSGHVEADEATSTLEPIVDEGEEAEGSPESSTYQSPTTTSGPTIPTGSKSKLPKKKSNQSLRRRKAKPQTVTTTDPLPGRKESSSSPSTEASSRFGSISARSDSVGFYPFDAVGDPSTAHLPEDIRFYLSYHKDSINYRHYFLQSRSANFVSQTVIGYALQYEPLLYAIVGFSAYHHCVHTSTGKLFTFLKYYNRALSLLRRSLGSGEPYSEATLATVLVLTTFEVCYIVHASWNTL